MIREILADEIRAAVEKLFVEANTRLPEDVESALRKAYAGEKSEVARSVLDDVLQNAAIAREQNVAMCQDTGLSYMFVELGQDVHIAGGGLNEAINEGVRDAYRGAYLRKSVVADPIFRRKNTGDNTPAVIYVEVVPGDRLTLIALPKGTGSENMSALAMLVPADGPSGIKRFIVETVERAGPNPCPPVIIGVGVGGMMDRAAMLAKKALLRPVGQPSSDPLVAELEQETLKDINALGFGAGGMGGTVTALAVHIETFPTHIGALPVAVNIQCHAARHAECVL